ncbi:MAG: class aldolase/adducin family protein [Herbinix sp.]|jgi:L-fuculose-phosphate aldolase|nr:class aldolase/adducin family protein [Herbinix sp.]
MKEQTAKELVVRAGHALIESGLIARTWGNVSCRVDKNTFVITPSGRSYETLTPEEVVLCNIEDASYQGDIKPSSEKRIHALLYRTRPDINFVIHTHQPQASAVSTFGLPSMPVSSYKSLPTQVPVASYGLPGTKKLRNNIETTLQNYNGNALMMEHHGALCFGEDYEATFFTAKELENACQSYIRSKYLEVSLKKEWKEEEFFHYYISKATGNSSIVLGDPLPFNGSERTQNGFILESDRNKEYQFTDPGLPPEAQLHSTIYQSREDINVILNNTNAYVLASSLANTILRPLLDDFAQIVGPSVRCAASTKPEDIVKALRGRLGVLVPGAGALCCAATKSDAHAVAQVMQKDALAQISASLFGKAKPLSLFDCKLMHFVYTKSYAKKA